MASWNEEKGSVLKPQTGWVFFNSPKVICVYFTRLVVATAISIYCLNLKKKRKMSYASIKLKCRIDTVSYSYCFKLRDCEQSLVFSRFSKESARARERRAAKLCEKRGRQLPRLPRSITRVFTFMSRAFHSSD